MYQKVITEAVLAIRPGRPWPTQILAWPTQIYFWPTLAVGLPKVIVHIIWTYDSRYKSIKSLLLVNFNNLFIPKPWFHTGNVQATVYNALCFSRSTGFVQIGFDSAHSFCLCGTQFFRDAQNQESSSGISVRNANKWSVFDFCGSELSDSIMKNPSSVVDAFASMGKLRLTLL